MKHVAAICIAASALAIGMVGTAASDAAKDDATDQRPEEFAGTFHPKKTSCAGCHAKATVLRTDAKYRLKVDVDYSGRKKKGPSNRVFFLEGSSSATNLVFTNKRYSVTITGDELVGKRIDEGVEVPIVLTMKRAKPPQKAEPDSR
jgi:hypothetical protein